MNTHRPVARDDPAFDGDCPARTIQPPRLDVGDPLRVYVDAATLCALEEITGVSLEPPDLGRDADVIPLRRPSQA